MSVKAAEIYRRQREKINFLKTVLLDRGMVYNRAMQIQRHTRCEAGAAGEEDMILETVLIVRHSFFVGLSHGEEINGKYYFRSM